MGGIDSYFTNGYANLFISNCFNIFYSTLLVSGLLLYIVVNLVEYFKSRNKSKITNAVLILSFIFLIVDIIIFLAICFPSSSLLPFIASVLLFGNTEEVYLFLGYLLVPIIGVVLFLNLFCGMKSAKEFISCLLINTLFVLILVLLIGGVLYPLMGILLPILLVVVMVLVGFYFLAIFGHTLILVIYDKIEVHNQIKKYKRLAKKSK